ncbi:MAG: mechanosensitive ion channel family protein [Fibrobacter sp.]|nr:mechanosensitive ion channel family protein [Fibrobacter sp.]
MDWFRSLIPKESLVEQVLLVVLVIIVVRLFVWFLQKGLSRAVKRGFDKAAIPLISGLVRYTLYTLALVLCLNILGVNTNSFLAVIGAASLAIGLAIKDALANVASGLLLLFLNPFKAGDYIECGNVKGKIGGIGLFNTTFETMDGLYVSAPNSTLWGAPIVNYSRNLIRRLDLSVGVSYDTSLDKVFAALREMVSLDSRFLKVPPPKYFVSELADSSVVLNVWVWVRTYEYHELKRQYMGIIKNLLDEHGVEIPFPQRVLHIPGVEPVVDKKTATKKIQNDLTNPDSDLMQIINGKKKANFDVDHIRELD